MAHRKKVNKCGVKLNEQRLARPGEAGAKGRGTRDEGQLETGKELGNANCERCENEMELKMTTTPSGNQAATSREERRKKNSFQNARCREESDKMK